MVFEAISVLNVDTQEYKEIKTVKTLERIPKSHLMSAFSERRRKRYLCAKTTNKKVKTRH